jgi:EAL domain-containing protein (putative c-di-GMP-specific phosphodiesterase class I)
LSIVTPVDTPSPLAALRSERDRFVAMAFCWADILLDVDADETVVYAAGAIEPTLGATPEQIVGTSLLDLVAPAERAQVRALLAGARRCERIEGALIRLIGPNGVSAPLRFAGYRLHDLSGHFFIALRHGEAPQRANGFGRRVRDDATGLYDADSFMDMVTGQLAAVGDDTDQRMSLIVLPGYDHLRQRLVDEAERDLLNAIGDRLGESSLDGETAARLGDDRYGFIHHPSIDLDALKERICELTKASDPLHQGTGIEAATMEFDEAVTADSATARGVVYALEKFRHAPADASAVTSLQSRLSDVAREAVEEVSRLKELITRADVEMAFQPVLNARSGSVLYYEALARMPAHYGIDAPSKHIDFAEETGLISQFDLAMLQKVIHWMETNTPRNGKASFAVNVSGQSLSALSYLAQVDRLLKENPWLRGRIVFEITQSGRITDRDMANNFIQRLRQQGFRVALDDFGAGAGSFDDLSRFDVDIVKIDGPAIIDAIEARKGKAFLRAMVAFCRELGVATVAEAVEDEARLAFCRDCGVPFVQGFLFGTPSFDMRAVNAAIPWHVFPERPRASGGRGG